MGTKRVIPALKILLGEGRIRASHITALMVKKELDGARKDLERGQNSLLEHDYKWATVQAYYSMFHVGRSLLYNRGYREKSHRGLLAALRILYSTQLSKNSLDDFADAMRLREDADYGLTYSEESARSVLELASTFLDRGSSILEKRRRNR